MDKAELKAALLSLSDQERSSLLSEIEQETKPDSSVLGILITRIFNSTSKQNKMIPPSCGADLL